MAGALTHKQSDNLHLRSRSFRDGQSPHSTNLESRVSQSLSSECTLTSNAGPEINWIPAIYNCGCPPICICRLEPGPAPGLLSSDEVLLAIYKKELSPSHPFVVVPQSVIASELEATRPFLLSAIRMVASFRSIQSMQAQMSIFMSRMADHMLVRSERSLDLLSAIVVVLGWNHYHCPLHTQLNNLLSLAIALTAELGLRQEPGRRKSCRIAALGPGEGQVRTNSEKRLLLGVWYLSSCVSLSFHQLDSMTFTPYMKQCLQELKEAREYESDAYLTYIIQIQDVSERVSRFKSAHNNVHDIWKAPTSAYASAYWLELEALRNSLPLNLKSNSLLNIQLETARLRLLGPLVENLDCGFVSELLTAPPPLAGTSSALDSLYHLNTTIKACFYHWLSFPTSSYHTIPMTTALQMLHATVALSRTRKRNTAAMPHIFRKSTSYSVQTACDQKAAYVRAALKSQLEMNRDLNVDVVAILDALADSLEQAGLALIAQSTDNRPLKHNFWSLNSKILRNLQMRFL